MDSDAFDKLRFYGCILTNNPKTSSRLYTFLSDVLEFEAKALSSLQGLHNRLLSFACLELVSSPHYARWLAVARADYRMCLDSMG